MTVSANNYSERVIIDPITVCVCYRMTKYHTKYTVNKQIS